MLTRREPGQRRPYPRLEVGAPWAINGQPFDPKRIDAEPKLGSVEVWRFINASTTMTQFRVV